MLAKGMHQIVQIEFENCIFQLLRGAHPLVTDFKEQHHSGAVFVSFPSFTLVPSMLGLIKGNATKYEYITTRAP